MDILLLLEIILFQSSKIPFKPKIRTYGDYKITNEKITKNKILIFDLEL